MTRCICPRRDEYWIVNQKRMVAPGFHYLPLVMMIQPSTTSSEPKHIQIRSPIFFHCSSYSRFCYVVVRSIDLDSILLQENLFGIVYFLLQKRKTCIYRWAGRHQWMRCDYKEYFCTTRWTPMVDDAIMNKGDVAVRWERKRWGTIV